ncbi:DUF952 domain-containing protein [Mycobacterium sp. TY814]|uniref:DUF952 domain-containing protein n=1 Tax=unclassified Mycobacterium TaxID=2642494 RepID=UPI000F94C6BB|nr:DUF952 domain-containing protein [Mycobacterium sp. TY814]MDP7721210.1 DUF952 domain-containing protein [Mycobacterium sp. TY814]RUP02207.1 MAG: DUF952 domain-containing protein [Mycobacterium sp.]
MTVLPTADFLVRLCSEQEWADARERGLIPAEPPEPQAEPFVHLSTIEQVHLPANRIYHGRDDMVLLYVDASALPGPVRWEPGVPSDPESMLFPHLYGPLPVEAVTEVVPYPPAADGSFPALKAHGP